MPPKGSLAVHNCKMQAQETLPITLKEFYGVCICYLDIVNDNAAAVGVL